MPSVRRPVGRGVSAAMRLALCGARYLRTDNHHGFVAYGSFDIRLANQQTSRGFQSMPDPAEPLIVNWPAGSTSLALFHPIRQLRNTRHTAGSNMAGYR
ncbi:hypothetical protein L2K20_28715 [Mycobacterium sp. MBM]|nr:hypothetical protein [Mycobacterium sp. MBM]